jgi:hypothetical protein
MRVAWLVEIERETISPDMRYRLHEAHERLGERVAVGRALRAVGEVPLLSLFAEAGRRRATEGSNGH